MKIINKFFHYKYDTLTEASTAQKLLIPLSVLRVSINYNKQET